MGGAGRKWSKIVGPPDWKSGPSRSDLSFFRSLLVPPFVSSIAARKSMNHFLSLLAHHGYILLCILVFSEAIGLPVPAALALVAAGAAAAAKVLSLPVALVLALIAMLSGDGLLYVLGRYTGWALLGILCRVSANPETCILRSAESFYKRGKITLIVAKFIPGLNTMGPPLAPDSARPESLRPEAGGGDG